MSDEDDIDDVDNDHNDWCLIESDPGVFTELLESLGCHHVELQELWSLDDDALLLEKVYGLIFLFQWTKESQLAHANAAFDVTGDDNNVNLPDGMWFGKQVATNACATQAILSILLNATTTTPTEEGHNEIHQHHLELGKTLSEFREFTKDFNAQIKGVSIAGSEELRNAHNAFALPETLFDDDIPKPHKPKSKDAEAFHFVAYIPYQGMVYELDGLMPGPIAVGEIPSSASASSMTPTTTTTSSPSSSSSSSWIAIAKEAIQTRMNHLPTEKFNLMAVIQDKRMNAAITPEDLEVEQQKRIVWKRENERRRHNYIPLVVQLLKELAHTGTPPHSGLQSLTQAAIARKKAKLTAKNNSNNSKNDAKEKDDNDDQGESKDEPAATMEE
jgi:ubiquitin carboxyl-terminal hydrolase L5